MNYAEISGGTIVIHTAGIGVAPGSMKFLFDYIFLRAIGITQPMNDCYWMELK